MGQGCRESQRSYLGRSVVRPETVTLAEKPGGHSTTAVEVGRAEHRERTSTLSSSRDEQGRQNSLERGTFGQRREVKLPRADQRAEQFPAQDEGKASAELWERVWERQNLLAAQERVERNGGAPGMDGMTVEELRPYLKEHWLEDREALDQQSYKPSPVRRVEIRGKAARDTDWNGSLSPTSGRTGAHAPV